MPFQPLAQNRHKTDGEFIVFSWTYMRMIKSQSAAQSAQNGKAVKRRYALWRIVGEGHDQSGRGQNGA
jgi:hypothetical protein